MNAEEKRLLDEFQRDFPLTPRPYATIAERVGMTEDEVIAAYKRLGEQKFVSRIGAVVAPNKVGASTLAAMRVPEDRLDDVAEYVSSFEQVNHNYEREHEINLWFVAATDSASELEAVLNKIADHTGIAVMSLPMIQDYHLDLGFKLKWS